MKKNIITLQRFKNLGHCPKFGYIGKKVGNNNINLLLLKKSILLDRIQEEFKLEKKVATKNQAIKATINDEIEATEWAKSFQLHTVSSISDKELLLFNEKIELPYQEAILTTKIDILVLIDKDEPYLDLYRFKTGEGISFKKDAEALFMSYIVMTLYGLPVRFNRIAHNGQKFSTLYSVEDMEYMDKLIKKYIHMPKEIMNIGEHCSQCSLVHDCKKSMQEKIEIDSLDSLVKTEELISAELKQIRAKKNALIKEKEFVQGKEFVGKIVNTPAYKLDFGESEKINKDKLKDWLLGEYNLPKPLINNLSLTTYSDEFANWLNSKNKGVTLKPYFRKVIKVERIKNKEDED